MLPYIINTSIVWLSSLLLYELLLRKERFHQYNRIYLIVSLIAGLALPAADLRSMIPADNKVINTLVYVNANSIQQPAMQVREALNPVISKEVKTSPNRPADADVLDNKALDFKFLLWMLYFAGILTGLILITREALQLIRLYKDGNRNIESGCVIVETRKNHVPFSFFNLVFIRNRGDYSEAQWSLLLTHEREHARQLHSLDNLLLISLRIVFWFHPLPYIYYKKLRIVHEFQADRAAATSVGEYGSFLLEQSLMQGAPILTHSFNYSPIKNRIAMLTTTNSARIRLLKYLAVFPLVLILLIFCTQTTLSGETRMKRNKMYFKGSEIEFATHKILPFSYKNEVQTLEKQKDFFQYLILPDSIPYEGWNGQIIMSHVPVDTTPMAINGLPIYGDEATRAYVPKEMMDNADGKYIKPVFTGRDNSLEQYLFANIQSDLEKLDNGIYALRLSNVVVGVDGNIVYYNYSGIFPAAMYDNNNVTVSDEVKNMVNRKITEMLETPGMFRPATTLKDHTPINVRVKIDSRIIEVRNHVAQLIQNSGC